MPDLSQQVVDDLTVRLIKYLSLKEKYSNPEYISSGGSAAVFKVSTPNGYRAFKVFDPSLISNVEGSKEKYRLSLQERLINHTCKNLVETYSVEFAEGTAFIEMEYIEWPQLKSVLSKIPDEFVATLIKQLVDVVVFLEKINIVHRDIKPENIHVSEDWSQLKLLDLGVVREIEATTDVVETDTGKLRIFLATAQYSSPEYLFRLDEPSDTLWKALNIYQVGAVLHDLIMKEPIFNTEIQVGNRWVLAKAVLLKPPSFSDEKPDRLPQLKILASRCLVKDMNLRMSLVKWSDFNISDNNNSFDELIKKLSLRRNAISNSVRQLEFERHQYKDMIINGVREKLIFVCKTDLPITVDNPSTENSQICTFSFNLTNEIIISSRLFFEWQDGIYIKNANITMAAGVFSKNCTCNFDSKNKVFIYNAAIQESDDSLILMISTCIANAINKALNIIDVSELQVPENNDGLDLHV